MKAIGRVVATLVALAVVVGAPPPATAQDGSGTIEIGAGVPPFLPAPPGEVEPELTELATAAAVEATQAEAAETVEIGPAVPTTTVAPTTTSPASVAAAAAGDDDDRPPWLIAGVVGLGIGVFVGVVVLPRIRSKRRESPPIR